MKKIIVLSICLCCLLQMLSAQEIRIEFSIKHAIAKDNEALSPYLQVKYENSGDYDYYLPSLFYLDSPIILYGSLKPPIGKDYLEFSLYEEHVFKGHHFDMPLQFISDYGFEHISLLFGNPDDDIINPILTTYYEESFPELVQAYNNHFTYPFFFNSNTLIDPIMMKQSQAFVFIRSGETVSQLISLCGIKEAQIILSVYLNSSKPPRGLTYQHMVSYPFPDMIDSYKLYLGDIASNRLEIDFSD